MLGIFKVEMSNAKVRSKIMFVAIICLGFLVSSCSGPYKSGKHKATLEKSVDKINDSIIENRKDSDEVPSSDLKMRAQKPKNLEPILESRVNRISDLKKGVGNIYRVPEKVVRVRVAGYETEDGDFVDSHNVFIVLKDSGWKKVFEVK